MEELKALIFQYFEANNDEIISLYKGNVAIFQSFEKGINERQFPDLQICFTDDELLIVNHATNNFNPDDALTKPNEVITGYTIAIYRDGKFVKCNPEDNWSLTEYKKINNEYVRQRKPDGQIIPEDEYTNYICDNDSCKKELVVGGMMCESCNYDLCHQCKHLSENHPHHMFEYRGYAGWNTYDSHTIITSITHKMQ